MRIKFKYIIVDIATGFMRYEEGLDREVVVEKTKN